MTFDLPDGGPLLAGPASAGGNATVRGGDSRPRVALLSDLSAPPPGANLYVVREEALPRRGAGLALRALRMRVRPALVAGPSSPTGDFDRWRADVIVMRPCPDPAESARRALSAGVRAAGRPLVVDVSVPVPADALMAALDVGAAGVVIDTGNELADAELLSELAALERARLVDAPVMTVAICVYNGAGDLDRCLASLRTLRYPNYEVLVVDDGSTDGSADVAKRYAVRLIELEHMGRGKARSAAIQAAEGEYIVFLDADEEATPDWLARLWRMHDRLGATTVGGPNRPFADAGWQERAVNGAPGVAMPIVRADGTCTHLPTCNFSIRSELVRRIGFHEELAVFGEDLHMCHQLIVSGHDLYFHPTASVSHHRRRSLRGYVEQMHDYARYSRATNEALGAELVEVETDVPLLRRLDPRRPHYCFVGPQADQRYNLAFAPLSNGFPLKVMMLTVGAAAIGVPAASRLGRGRQALGLAAAAIAGQTAYVAARVPAHPRVHGIRALANRLVTAALWYAGPAATGIGKHITPPPEMPDLTSEADPAPPEPTAVG